MSFRIHKDRYLYQQSDTFNQYITVSGPLDLGYGQFSYDLSVNVSGSYIATPIPYNTTEIAKYCSYSGSSITILKAGTWKFAYSIQLDKSGGGTTFVDIWIKVNGTNVPRSASRTTVVGQNGENFVYCEYVLSLNLNDTIQVYFSSPDNTMTAASFPAQTTGNYAPPNEVPAVPSIISTLVQLSI